MEDRLMRVLRGWCTKRIEPRTESCVTLQVKDLELER